jgi:hypothetical protein
MRRFLSFLVLALAASAATASAGVERRSQTPLRPAVYGGGHFALACGFSHRNQDDPIVHPGEPGRSHDHTFFGNTSTDADSTPASLRRAGRTTCRLPADTAAYWAPTLFRDGRPVEPLGVVAVYSRRTLDAVDGFPAGLRIIAGDAAARAPQGTRVTYWTCGERLGARSATIPTCVGRFGGLRLHVNFPDCWDGVHRDSGDHKSHMAYSRGGECPLSHPVEVPALSLIVYYPVSGVGELELASGGQLSGHADFVNAWHQRTLDALVDRYLNRAGFGPKRP